MKTFSFLLAFNMIFALATTNAKANSEIIRLHTTHQCSHIVNSNNMERFSEKRMVEIKTCAKEESLKKVAHLCRDIYQGKLRLTKASLVDCSEKILNGKSILRCAYEAKTFCLYSLR